MNNVIEVPSYERFPEWDEELGWDEESISPIREGLWTLLIDDDGSIWVWDAPCAGSLPQ